MSGTNDWFPSVPMTSGYTPCVPEPGVEIWREIPGGTGTGDSPTKYEKVYPFTPGKSHE